MSVIYCGCGIHAKIGSYVRGNAIKLSVVGADFINYICFFASMQNVRLDPYGPSSYDTNQSQIDAASRLFQMSLRF